MSEPLKITKNMCICPYCGDLITSKIVHDFQTCKCGACTTDGGNEYLHRSGESIDVSEYNQFKVGDYVKNGKKTLEINSLEGAKIANEKKMKHATILDAIKESSAETVATFIFLHLKQIESHEKTEEFLKLRLTKELVEFLEGGR